MNSSETEKTTPGTPPPPAPPSPVRVRTGLALTLGGLLIFLIGARPAWFGMDRSPVVGFVQISVFLVGLAFICLGGYISLNAYWRKGGATIAADIGLRLVSTGYVISVFAGMADVFGFGQHVRPQQVPFFGLWQAAGVQIGMGIIAIGFLLLLPHKQRPPRPTGLS
ncbi:MAG: hypothetical protein FJZ96_07930 [Chloroflexi bacterium]|nr:hypothetical protein [Chloroflexota bacterium]